MFFLILAQFRALLFIHSLLQQIITIFKFTILYEIFSLFLSGIIKNFVAFYKNSLGKFKFGFCKCASFPKTEHWTINRLFLSMFLYLTNFFRIILIESSKRNGDTWNKIIYKDY